MENYLHFPNTAEGEAKEKKGEMVRGQSEIERIKSMTIGGFFAAIRTGFDGFGEPSDSDCRDWAGVGRPTRAPLASCSRSDSRWMTHRRRRYL